MWPQTPLNPRGQPDPVHFFLPSLLNSELPTSSHAVLGNSSVTPTFNALLAFIQAFTADTALTGLKP